MNLDELLQELKNLKEKEINLHTEIKNIKIKRDEICDQYVQGLDLLKVGTKIRITEEVFNYQVGMKQTLSTLVYVGETKFLQDKWSYDHSKIYENKHLGTILYQVKKDGSQSSRIYRANDVIKIEVVE
jgi:hypothetical protein